MRSSAIWDSTRSLWRHDFNPFLSKILEFSRNGFVWIFHKFAYSNFPDFTSYECICFWQPTLEFVRALSENFLRFANESKLYKCGWSSTSLYSLRFESTIPYCFVYYFKGFLWINLHKKIKTMYYILLRRQSS